MGAYKDYKTKLEEIDNINSGLDYALLKAGVDVCEAAKLPDGSIDYKKIHENPGDFKGIYTESLETYMQKRLMLDPKAWSGLNAETKKRLLKSFGITPNIVNHVIGEVIPKGQLMQFGEVLNSKHFKQYRTEQEQEYLPAQEILGKGYDADKLGTVNEALTELKLTNLIKPEAVGLSDLAILEQLALKAPSDKLEEILKKSEPRLLKSSYQ